MLAGLVIAATLATVVSWRRQLLGGALLAAVGGVFCAFGYVTAGRNKLLAVAVSGLPFLTAGLLLLAGAERKAKQEDAAQ